MNGIQNIISESHSLAIQVDLTKDKRDKSWKYFFTVFTTISSLNSHKKP